MFGMRFLSYICMFAGVLGEMLNECECGSLIVRCSPVPPQLGNQ